MKEKGPDAVDFGPKSERTCTASVKKGYVRIATESVGSAKERTSAIPLPTVDAGAVGRFGPLAEFLTIATEAAKLSDTFARFVAAK